MSGRPFVTKEDAQLVRTLCEIESGLTDWECEFAESLSRWIQGNRSLTEKQRATAEKILTRLGK